MKKFKITQTSKTLDASKLTKEQMNLTTGGLYARPIFRACTSGTRSICHIDGTDDSDCYAFA